jgi:Tfp pilus assembly protein PilN
MREIDFIPSWYRASRRRKRDLVIRAVFLSVLAVEMILVSVGSYIQRAAAREDLAELETSFAGQAEVITSLSQLVLRLEELRDKRQLLSDVTGGAPVHGVLAELSHLMPEATALTRVGLSQSRRIGAAGRQKEGDAGKVAAQPDDDEGTLEITGWAASDVHVGSLMTNLARSPLFGDVRLRYSKPVAVNDREVRAFQLTCELPQFD